MHGVFADFPHTVDEFVVATETSGRGFGQIFVIHAQTFHAHFAFAAKLDITESFAQGQRVTAIGLNGQGFSGGKIGNLSVLDNELVVGFAIGFVHCFFLAFTIIEIHFAIAFHLIQDGEAESFLSEIEQTSAFYLLTINRFVTTTGQTEGRGFVFGRVEIPVTGQLIFGGRSIGSLAAFVYPFLVFESNFPGSITAESFALQKETGRRGLIMYLDVDFVFSGGQFKFLRHTEKHLAINLDIVVAFHLEQDIFVLGQIDFGRKFYGDVMTVLFPERRKIRAAVGTTIVHVVAQPDFVITGKPYPCCFHNS